MSNLEGRAKPVVERLLNDGPTQLSSADQAVAAEWAIKMAMVFEAFLGPASYFYTPSERSQLRDSRQLPKRTSVWLAKCVDLPDILGTATTHSATMQRAADEAKLYTTTLAFGHVAVQVATGRAAPGIPDAVRMNVTVQPGPWARATIQIWPITTDPAHWPAELGLAGEYGVNTFAGRWFGSDGDQAAV